MGGRAEGNIVHNKQIFLYIIPYKINRPALVRCSTGSVAGTI